MNILIYVLIGVGLFLIAFWILKTFKFPKLGCLTLISGGVKTGKSTFSVALAIRQYKKEFLE